jgi:ABC-type transport system involved in multi-copper enzyme maturation permease subunit
MKTIFTIAKYTAVEALRDNFIYVVIALMIAGVPLGIFIKSVTLFGADSSYSATILMVLSVAVIAISVLYVNIATRRELDGKIMLVILSRPVLNWQYLLGKLLGFWSIATLYCAAAGILLAVLRLGSIKTVLVYIFGLWLLQVLIILWSLFFALLLNSMVGGILASLLAWFFCTSVQTLWYLSTRTSDNILSQIIGNVFYYLMPNYGRYDFGHAVLYSAPVDALSVAILPLYTVIYGAIILLLAWIDFSKKEY